jgi:hypothetical protein
MEGDIFEMEDQRNWSDLSYKTYCTPLALPFPVTLEAGTKIRQKITLRLLGNPPHIRVLERTPTLHVELAKSVPLPNIGLSCASHGKPLSLREIKRLKKLRLAHLWVDLHTSDDIQAQLYQASEESTELGCALEVAARIRAAAYLCDMLQLDEISAHLR